MPHAISDLSQPQWDTSLVQLLVDTSTAIARLDERISASSVTAAWQLRASWSGYGRAFEAHGVEIEEIDIFSRECGVPLPSRAPISTISDPFDALISWQNRFAGNERLHWSDNLKFSFSAPPDWAERPALLRALELQARSARADAGFSAWLELPLLLQRLGFTRALLPILVAGDKAYRIAPNDHSITRRFLRRLNAAAMDGMALLDAMEADRLRFSEAIAKAHRPGSLAALVTLLMRHPVASPTRAAQELGLSISGAGKLLKRAVGLGLLVEAEARHNWQLYLTGDLAVRFGFKSAPRGRPASRSPPSPELDTALMAFDAELAAFERRIEALASKSKSDPEIADKG